MAAFHKLINVLVLLLLANFIFPAAGFAVSKPQVQILAPIRTGVLTPVRIAQDQAGNFYLTDPKAGGVLKFDKTGLLTATFTLKKPQGIAVTDSGDLIVGQGDAVSVMDSSGNLKFRLGKGVGQFKMADGIAIDSAGYIYVVDSLDNCVQVFNATGAAVNTGNAAVGKPANSFGSSGSGNGQFSMPTGISYEKVSGQLAIADTLNGRIQFLDTAGVWKRSFGALGAGAFRFTSPVSVAFEYLPGSNSSLQRMYVTDSFQSSVQVIEPAVNPVWLGFIGSYGKSNGKLLNPSDALVDPVGGRLLVANGFGNISVYGINGGGLPTDTVPPTLTVNPVPQVTSSTAVTISGTVEAGAKITLSTDTAAVAGIPVMSSSTDWSVQVSGLVQGLNGIAVSATDLAGNSALQQVYVTYSPQAVSLTINKVTTPTNSSSQTISGSMDAGAVVSVAINTAAVAGTVTYPSATAWSSTISGLVVGENIITVTAAKAGSETAVSKAAITLKTALPVLSLAMLAEGSVTSAQLLTVNGLTDESILSVTINGDSVATVKGAFSKGLLLGSGANSITVTATDTAGNKSTLTRNIVYDPLAPVVSISSPTGGEVTNQNIIQVTGISPLGSSTVIKVNGTVQSTVSTANWTVTVTLASGPGLYTVEAVTTAAAKTASAAVTVSLVDLTVPAVNIASPPRDLATGSNSLAVSGIAGAASVSATLNGISLPVTFDPATGRYVLTMNFTTEGEYLLAVTATDAFGNTSTVIRTLIYDITPPLLTVTSQSATQVVGSGDSGAVVIVKDVSGAVVGTAAVGSNGAWSLPLTGTEPLPLNVYVLDAAGNSSRNGDINVSGGAADIFDAVRAMRIAVKLDPLPTAISQEFLRGDVAPLLKGDSMPDGKIDMDDVLVILMKIAGLLK